jgi:hypothetical protein
MAYGESIRWYMGVITARTAADGAVDTIRYDAQALDHPNIRVTNHLPERRIAKDVNIVAAEVGDPCLVWVRRQGTTEHFVLFPLTEAVRFVEACP